MMTTENRGACDPGASEREFHPLANLFPLMTGAAFDDLVADIKANGLREPILLDRRGRILDGRNRYRACRAAGVEPRYVTWEGEGGEAELVLSLNLHRRHLNESQRAMAGARLAKMMEEEATKRKGRHREEKSANLHSFPPGASAKTAGAQVNVSARLISYAIKVLRNGCEELIAAVDSGEMPVSTASLLAALPCEEQAKVLAGGATEITARVRQLRGARTEFAAGPSPGAFGILYQKAALESAGGTIDGADPVVFLWLPSSALPAAIAALKARGFEYAPPEG